MIGSLKKQLLAVGVLFGCFGQTSFGQEALTGLYKNEVIEQAYRQTKMDHHKAKSFIYYESVAIPFVDDFSHYTGYPDTALWIGRQAFVNQSFAVNPPTIGCVTLDAIDERGRLYEHASRDAFAADTLLSRPIRLDSIFSPLPKALTPADSVLFCFFYQPGGGLGPQWIMGNAPDKSDSLVLEFGYQTGDIALLYYITDTFTVPTTDTIAIGDTVYSHCDPTLFVIADMPYGPGDKLALPCDSVTAMEVIWRPVWASDGLDLTTFISKEGSYFKHVLIPITDSLYFNRGFQFRFRNYASLEYEIYRPAEGSNVDFWNIDYIRLDRDMGEKDTAIDDVAIVDNPGGILKQYTSMPWNQFQQNQAQELVDTFAVKLSNLFNITKNTYYNYKILDEQGDTVAVYDGGSENLAPFSQSGYQTFLPHVKPPLAKIAFPPLVGDSLTLKIQHIFKATGSGDKNQNNDTACFVQKFHNYFAYDDGIPEAGYVVHTTTSPYKTALAVAFSLNRPDTLQAIDIYINHTLGEVSEFDFTLTVWADDAGKPGKELYSHLVSQSFSNDLYGFQRFYPEYPFLVSDKIYIGYQTNGGKFLNVGYDLNNDNRQHVFWKTNSKDWATSVYSGTPMLRLVLGKAFSHTAIDETPRTTMATIYPNPANDKLYIKLAPDTPTEQLTIALYSITGQKIVEMPYTPELSLADYASGFYLLRLTDAHQQRSSIHKFSIAK
jgi:hypothetical protein